MFGRSSCTAHMSINNACACYSGQSFLRDVIYNNRQHHKIIIRSILLTKTTAAQNEVAPSYHIVSGLYFLAVVFVATIAILGDKAFIYLVWEMRTRIP